MKDKTPSGASKSISNTDSIVMVALFMNASTLGVIYFSSFAYIIVQIIVITLSLIHISEPTRPY